MTEKKISMSIVTYKTCENILERCINSVLTSSLKIKLCIIDNSPKDSLRLICNQIGVDYLYNQKNTGYGAGHNIALRRSIDMGIKYHLVLNPDIHFEDDVLRTIYDYMESNKNVGLLMPKVLYPDGSVQHLCKLMPSPLGLFRRRFLSSLSFLKKLDDRYELRFTKYDKVMDVPNLSGCFMFLRTNALEKVGLFDERFFMYFEDVDLVRRLKKYYQTVYYPHVCVYHDYERGSYKNFRLLKCHVESAIKYFKKWGFIFDFERHRLNKSCLQNLNLINKDSAKRQEYALE